MKPILVTTKHRGVFAGLVPNDQDMDARTMALEEARMAIYWGTTGGVAQLAATGPTGKSKIGAAANIPALHDITAVWDIAEEAWKAWSSKS